MGLEFPKSRPSSLRNGPDAGEAPESYWDDRSVDPGHTSRWRSVACPSQGGLMGQEGDKTPWHRDNTNWQGGGRQQVDRKAALRGRQKGKVEKKKNEKNKRQGSKRHGH